MRSIIDRDTQDLAQVPWDMIPILIYAGLNGLLTFFMLVFMPSGHDAMSRSRVFKRIVIFVPLIGVPYVLILGGVGIFLGLLISATAILAGIRLVMESSVGR